ncbi:MAG: AmmeMemoRadiSam system radical SAM enzyme [Acidobacteria bacterium]|nr:AmmeMemoRadiSam system radical SAM enzyme [Acidobacteriota bacterium]
MSATDTGRRRVVGALLAGGCAACLARGALAQDQAAGAPLASGEGAGLAASPARWWKELDQLRVECNLCPRKCRVADMERGACGVRENRAGKYVTLVHSRACALHLDPVEKKPFYHVLPGAAALSLGVPGCNIECKFCQNWEIAQVRPEQVRTSSLSPGDLVQLARRHGAPTLAATYTEPVVWAEYVRDIAIAGNKAGLRTLMISNGFILPEPMNELADVLAAVKVDLKAFSEKFYKEQCRGELKPVLDTLRLLAKRRMWTEIVVLLIPGLNDGEAEARALARFVRDDVGPEVPVHFTRFHPSYRMMNVPPTPVSSLERARDAARAEGLKYVYVGNVPGHPGNHTYCPGCGATLIRRTGLAVLGNRLQSGKCPDCSRAIPGIWS